MCSDLRIVLFIDLPIFVYIPDYVNKTLSHADSVKYRPLSWTHLIWLFLSAHKMWPAKHVNNNVLLNKAFYIEVLLFRKWPK